MQTTEILRTEVKFRFPNAGMAHLDGSLFHTSSISAY